MESLSSLVAHGLSDARANGQGAELSVQVQEFLAALAAEQTRFLAAVADASVLLRDEPGHVGQVAAAQHRLTQQFFDGQRAIIKRRAEFDADAAAVVESAEAESGALVDDAHLRAAAAGRPVDAVWAPPRCAARRVDPRRAELPGAALGRLDPDEMPRSVRQQIADLGAAVVRTRADAEWLAPVIDGAFEPDEFDGSLAKQQLQSLLDEWWRAANAAGGDAIDDARARAAMRIHVAQIEAGEIAPAQIAPAQITPDDVELAPEWEAAQLAEPPQPFVFTAPPTTPPVHGVHGLPTPAPMFAALDNADHADLDSVLASLLDALPATPAVGAPLPAPVVAPEAANPAATQQDVFDRFWGRRVPGGTRKGARDLVLVQVLLPAVVIVGLLALLLVWVG